MILREDVKNQLYYKKKMEMTQRKDEKFILSEKFLGKNYVVTLPEGLRLYRADSEKIIAQPINAWLRIVGVFLFFMGVMGFILERRIYKIVT
jgi:hypothetical protein